MRRWLVVLGLVLVACSGSSDDEEGVELHSTMPTGDPAAVDVIAAAVLADGQDDPNALPFDEASSRCVAEALVLGFEPERLEELGLDVDAGAGPDLYEPPLTSEEADATYEIFDRCVDLVGELTEVFASECIAQHYYDADVLRDALFLAEPDAEVNGRIDAALEDAASACE